MKIYQTDFAKVFFGDKSNSLSHCEKLAKKPIVFGHQVHGADLLEVYIEEVHTLKGRSNKSGSNKSGSNKSGSKCIEWIK